VKSHRRKAVTFFIPEITPKLPKGILLKISPDHIFTIKNAKDH
jgi:hypothetical protein